jgi:hypothetical protein
MEKPFRPLRMLGSITALLAALFWVERAYEIVVDALWPLMRYGNQFTAYGWGVIGDILVRAILAGILFWVFARLGGSKPVHLPRLPRLSRSS